MQKEIVISPKTHNSYFLKNKDNNHKTFTVAEPIKNERKRNNVQKKRRIKWGI